MKSLTFDQIKVGMYLVVTGVKEEEKSDEYHDSYEVIERQGFQLKPPKPTPTGKPFMVSAKSYPFLSIKYLQDPMDLESVDYRRFEFGVVTEEYASSYLVHFQYNWKRYRQHMDNMMLEYRRLEAHSQTMNKSKALSYQCEDCGYETMFILDEEGRTVAYCPRCNTPRGELVIQPMEEDE